MRSLCRCLRRSWSCSLYSRLSLSSSPLHRVSPPSIVSIRFYIPLPVSGTTPPGQQSYADDDYRHRSRPPPQKHPVDNTHPQPSAAAKMLPANDHYNSTVEESPAPYTVFIEGNVGSGKTTFLENFADYPNVFLAQEPMHKWQDVCGHNFLGLMYQDPKRWSFAFQSIVQRTLMELHQTRPTCGQNVKIMERSIYSARNIFVENLFVDGLMAAPEYAVLDAWYKWLIENVKIESDLIIYLRADPEVAYQRIKARNRSEEKNISLEYIKHLHELHENWLNVHKTNIPKNVPVIIVDANQNMDLVKKQCQSIKDLITKNASAIIKSKSSSNISELGKSLNDIQHISPNCKLMPDSTIAPAQAV